MEINVLVQRVDANGFRAVGVGLPALEAEAPTRAEALEKIRSLMQAKMSQGELVRLVIPEYGDGNPWRKIAGMFKDHPDLDEVLENMAEYRRQVNKDPDRL